MKASGRTHKAVKVFFSYAREDKTTVDELEKYLVHLRSTKMISVWKDGQLKAGQDWDAEIKSNLVSADVVLLMLSIDFLNSKYICETELSIALERHRKGLAVLIPILLRPLPEGANPFPVGQGLPAGFVPIHSWTNREDAYVSVSNGIKAAVEELCGTKPAGTPEVARRRARNHIFCNRDEQEFEFVSTCRQLLRTRPGIPQVYVIRGEPLDRPDTLVERLFRTKIPALISARLHEKRAGLRPSILKTPERELGWPELGLMLADDYFQNSGIDPFAYSPAATVHEVSGSCIVRAAEVQPFSFVVVRHDINVTRLGAQVFEFLDWYVNALYRDLQGGAELPQFLIFINLIFRERFSIVPDFRRSKNRVKQLKATVEIALGKLCPQAQNPTANFAPSSPGCPCKVLKELAPLDLTHIHQWILGWEPAPTELEAERESRRIFTQLSAMRDGPVRLDILADWAEKERIYE